MPKFPLSKGVTDRCGNVTERAIEIDTPDTPAYIR